MCGGGNKTKAPDPVQAYQHNPQNVADNSADTYDRARVVAGTASEPTFGAELGASAGSTATINRG